ncbi:MAG: HEAT repeat domain-containing protein [Myxococcales bacterium]|nr:HEAT repeat domain-containing protein [Myxococcales bacterium]
MRLAGLLSVCVSFCVALGAALPSGVAAEGSSVAPHVRTLTGGRLELVWGNSRTVLPVRGVRPEDVRTESMAFDGERFVLAQWPLAGQARRGVLLRAVPDARRLTSVWEGDLGALDPDGEVRVEVRVTPEGLERTHHVAALRRCDGRPAELFPARFDPKRRVFVPAPRASERGTLLAARSVPLADAPSSRFRVTGASGPATRWGEPGTLLAPRGLTEGRGAGVWTPGADGGFVSVGAAARVPITGMRFIAPREGGGGWPARITFSLSPRHRYTVEVLDPLAEALEVALPAPVESGCVTVDIEGTATPAPPPPVGLGGVQVQTLLDDEAALGYLVGRIAAGTHCAAALRLLDGVRQPDACAAALIAALPSQGATGQLCTLRALASLPEGSVPHPAGWLPDALPVAVASLGRQEAPPEAAEVLRAWMRRAGATVDPALVGVVRDPSASLPGRAFAAAELATRADGETRQRLLVLLGAEETDTNKVVREAVARAKGPSWLALLAGMLGDAPAAGGSPEGRRQAELLRVTRARIASGDRPLAESRAALVARARALSEPSGDFLIRARALELLGELSAVEALGPLTRDADPVIRHLAVAATGASDTDRAKALLREALRDRDPRVRQTAARGLSTRADVADAGPALLTALLAERWEFVKAAYLEGLSAACTPGVPWAESLRLDDLPLDARLVSFQGLARCVPPAGHEEARRLLARQQAPVSLRTAAADLLRERGAHEDAALVARTLAHLVNQSASDPGLEDLARSTLEALLALDAALGVDFAEKLVAQERPRLRRLAVEALGGVCARGAVPLLRRLARSQEPGLSVRARASLSSCGSQADQRP